MRKMYSYQGAYSKKQAAPHNSKANKHGGYGYKPPRQSRSRRPREASEAKSLWMIAFFPLTFLYYELLLRIALGEPMFKYFFYVLFFSLSAGFLFYSLCNLFKSRKAIRIASISVLTFFTLLFLIEFFCKQFFTFFMGLSVMFQSAGEMMRSYFGVAVNLVLKSFHIVLLYFVPLVIYCLVFKEPVSRRIPPFFSKLVPACLCVLCYGIAIIGVLCSSAGIVTSREYYTSEFNITESSMRFGLVTGFRLDAQYLVFGTPKAKVPEIEPSQLLPVDDPENSSSIISSEVKPVEYDYNIMDIDFDSLIANTSNETLLSMHKYFASQPGTKQNEYTGMFKGKNLIVITAEAFSHYVIDPVRTPTLYRLATKGIHFTNYYQPAWGVSTSDGEYSHLLGLVPKAGLNSMKASAENNLYFTLGNQTSRLGYLTLAYHNNSNTYYGRNLTHPNLGYSKFIAMGSGLEGIEKVWPRSDLQLMQNSVQDYINSDQPFSIYYMTVSGHAEYTWAGNMMAYRNKDTVADLPLSEPCQAYLACNMELEYAMKYLVEQLEAAGKADDTVIVLTADHYPYGLETESSDKTEKYKYINELAGHTIDTNAELHKNALIIWSGCLEDQEPIEVTDPCYSLDILPTVSNLFGLEYDSRLLVGRDVFSDAAPLVLFRNYSCITDKGYYNASTHEFQVASGVSFASEEEQENYIKNISNIVKNKVTYSKYILEEDYYDLLFGN